MRPILVFAQAVPIFALAPILTLWLGYGLASKILMVTLVISFPVASAFYDGLMRTPQGQLDRLGRITEPGVGAVGEEPREVVVGHGVVRLESEGLLPLGDGLDYLALRKEGGAEVDGAGAVRQVHARRADP